MTLWLASLLRRLAYRMDGLVLAQVPPGVLTVWRENPECELVINYQIIGAEGVEAFVQQDPGGTQ
jgi:hypothetical protein